ncbi:MAG: tetratricopeptide repeat protein [Steroidobacteraceae bacterium]
MHVKRPGPAPHWQTPSCRGRNIRAALCKLGRLKEAEAEFRRAVAVKPKRADAHGNLGNVFRSAGRPAESETAAPRYVKQ